MIVEKQYENQIKASDGVDKIYLEVTVIDIEMFEIYLVFYILIKRLNKFHNNEVY